jgi:hypothetical protein
MIAEYSRPCGLPEDGAATMIGTMQRNSRTFMMAMETPTRGAAH